MTKVNYAPMTARKGLMQGATHCIAKIALAGGSPRAKDSVMYLSIRAASLLR